MTGHSTSAAKGNEFDYVIFSRADGQPRAHGPTEQKAWEALLRQKYGEGRRQDFKTLQLKFEKIDHHALRCGERGRWIWVEHMLLDSTVKMLGGA